MSETATNVIYGLCANGIPVYDESKAAAALSPGHVLERTSADTVQKHSTAGGTVAVLMVAQENQLEGQGTSDAYAQNDIVRIIKPCRGDRVRLLLKANENVAIGDKVESAGDGTVRKQVTSSLASTAPNRIIGIFRAASNVSSVVLVDVEVG